MQRSNRNEPLRPLGTNVVRLSGYLSRRRRVAHRVAVIRAALRRLLLWAALGAAGAVVLAVVVLLALRRPDILIPFVGGLAAGFLCTHAAQRAGRARRRTPPPAPSPDPENRTLASLRD